MSLPTGDMYVAALQNPSVAFDDVDLKTAQVETQRTGLPRPFSGAFTMTFHLRGRAEWAVRCFTREVPEVRQRYDSITRFLLSVKDPVFAKAELKPKGILVGSTRYDIIKMEWQFGDQLHVFIRKNLQEPVKLAKLAERIIELAVRLEQLGVAHGDLQHGNILVTDTGDLRLVDYDDVFLPELAGIGHSSGLGHMNYQHPGRRDTDYNADVDRFSIYMIYVGILALAESPVLWERFDGGDEKVLFGREDFLNPRDSALFAELSRLPPIAAWIDKLAAICEGRYATIPSVTEFLDGRFRFGRYAPAPEAKTRPARPKVSRPHVVTASYQQAPQRFQAGATTPSAATGPQSTSGLSQKPSRSFNVPTRGKIPWRAIVVCSVLLLIVLSRRGQPSLPTGNVTVPVVTSQQQPPLVTAFPPASSDTSLGRVVQSSPKPAPNPVTSAHSNRVSRSGASGRTGSVTVAHSPKPQIAESSATAVSAGASTLPTGAAMGSPRRSLTDVAERGGRHEISPPSKEVAVGGAGETSTYASGTTTPGATVSPPRRSLTDVAEGSGDVASARGRDASMALDSIAAGNATDPTAVPPTASSRRSLLEIADSSRSAMPVSQAKSSADASPTPTQHLSLTDIAEASAQGLNSREQIVQGSVMSHDASHITINTNAGAQTFSLVHAVNITESALVRVTYRQDQVQEIRSFVNGGWQRVY